MATLLTQLSQDGWKTEAVVAHPPFQKLLQSAGIVTMPLPVIVDIVGDWKGLLKGIVLFPWAAAVYLFLVWKYRSADVVLVSSFAEKIFASFACWVLQKPIIWIEFAAVEPLLTKFGGFPGFWYRLAMRVPKTIITSSQHSAKQLTKELPSIADKLVVVPCGIVVPPPPFSSQKFPAQTTIVCVSRLESGKGQDVLLRAFAQVLEEVPKAQLRIVGTGDFLRQLQTLARELGIEKQVTFAGYVLDAYDELRQAHLCVFPTLWQLEGFGMVAVEAMAVGTPVVAFEYGPIPEIITHQQTGLLAQPGDIMDLSAQIISILKNQNLAGTLSRQAYQSVQERFSITVVSKAYRHIFEQV